MRAEAEGVDPEAALRAAARAYRDAVVAAEGGAAPDRSGGSGPDVLRRTQDPS